MKIIFADTFYWIALLSPRDTWHLRVIEWSQSNPHVSLVMTDGIVHEIFAHFSKQGDIKYLSKINYTYLTTSCLLPLAFCLSSLGN